MWPWADAGDTSSCVCEMRLIHGLVYANEYYLLNLHHMRDHSSYPAADWPEFHMHHHAPLLALAINKLTLPACLKAQPRIDSCDCCIAAINTIVNIKLLIICAVILLICASKAPSSKLSPPGRQLRVGADFSTASFLRNLQCRGAIHITLQRHQITISDAVVGKIHSQPIPNTACFQVLAG